MHLNSSRICELINLPLFFRIVERRSAQRNFQLIVITHDKDFIDKLSGIERVEHYIEVIRNERFVQFFCSSTSIFSMYIEFTFQFFCRRGKSQVFKREFWFNSYAYVVSTSYIEYKIFKNVLFSVFSCRTCYLLNFCIFSWFFLFRRNVLILFV